MRYDAAIVGGGAAGCACAIGLAWRGLNVLLLDRPAQRRQPGEALAPAANRFLRELGLFERFVADAHLPSFGNLAAWGSEELSSTDFIHNPDGHGWHTDRPKFDLMLSESAANAGAHVYADAHSVDWWRTEDRTWRIQTHLRASVIECEAKWLVDCTGRTAAVARSQSAKRHTYDRLIATLAFFRAGASCADAESVTLIEAAESGWWYTARLPGGSRIAVYFTDAGGRTSTIARTWPGFSSLLAATRHIGPRLNDRRIEGVPFAMAANTSSLEQPWGDGWIAAGDAAAAHDPLSSMGIAGALCGGMHAADALSDAIAGDTEALPRYGRVAATAFEAYLKAWSLIYAEEQRWPHDSFWQARRSAPAIRAASNWSS